MAVLQTCGIVSDNGGDMRHDPIQVRIGQRMRQCMREAGLREVRMRFDFAGTSVLAHS